MVGVGAVVLVALGADVLVGIVALEELQADINIRISERKINNFVFMKASLFGQPYIVFNYSIHLIDYSLSWYCG